MDDYPKRFSIIDFYLNACQKYSIMAVVKPNLKLLDVGKIDSLRIAEDFIC
jgi:hypothetical protein